MAESQPGQVAEFDPSITLDNFTAESRDRFMFNENQLVLAKLQQPRPVWASAVCSEEGGVTFDEYKNLSGEFVYFDGSFQALTTPGVPTYPVDEIIIGFDRQITTDTIKFWSTGFVATGTVAIEWSFDNVTWFDAGALTWVEEFDSSIEVFPGDVPPTGEYVYTATIDGGVITGRYWKVEAADALSGVTELRIIPTLGPVLEHWSPDGTKVVTNVVEGDNYYDMAYDKNDDVYYALRFDTSLGLADTIDPDDNFNDTSTGDAFDSSRWVESTAAPYFIHNTTSGTLDMTSAAGSGLLTGTYGLDDQFITTIEFVSVFELNTDACFSIEGIDYTSGNEYVLSGLKGPYIPAVNTSGTFVSASIEYVDTIGSAAQLQNFRIKPEAFDFSFAGNEVIYTLTYVAGNDNYSVTASGITHADATPGVPYTLMDSATFTISNVTTPADGQAFTVTARTAETPILGTAVSGIALQIERYNTNSYSRYEDTDVPGFVTLHTGNIPSGTRVRAQLSGDPNGADVNIAADNFTSSGTGSVFFDTPAFSVVTIDKSGSASQVTSVSDADGYAIKSFDIIRDPLAVYNSYLTPRVGIATNGADVGSGGEIYIKVNDVLYKYAKSDLPLVNETGSNASATSTGEIPATTITNFAYNGYSTGGLSYIEYVSDLSGVFLKSISTIDLLAIEEKVFLDVASIAFPFAWNVSDLATLYFVDTLALKLYDLNETKAAFVNVTSDTQVLAAGTSDTATITAQVLNVYGEPKASKSMTFSVSAGDGAISPAVGCSDVNGEDTTVYTVGSSVGTATITVTVSDLTC